MADAARPNSKRLTSAEADLLRRRAEKLLSGLEEGSTPVHQDAAAILHELRVHQIQLEMQNEELRDAQLELDNQRDKYFDLFDLAPVGYLTVNSTGIVADANLTALNLLGVQRQMLVKEPFSAFVFPADRSAYNHALLILEQTGEVQACDLRLRRLGASSADDGAGYFWARLESRHRTASGQQALTWVTFTDIDEVKKEEQALGQSERWLSESQRIARIGHYVYDIERDRWHGSLTLYDVLGVGEAAYVRDFAGWLAIGHPADRERLATYFADEVVAKRKPFNIEYRIVRPCDGVERWVHGLGTVEFASDGHAAAMFGVIQDITERKLAEIEAERQRALLAQAEAIGHIGSWRVGLQADGVREWSEEAIRVLGLGASGAGDDGFEAFYTAVHPDDRHVLEGWSDAIQSTTEPCPAEFRIVRPDGETRVVCVHGARETGESDGEVTVAGIVHDVTERLTGRHNLRGFDLLVEHAMAQAMRAGQGVGLIFCDLDGLKAINDEFGHGQGDRALQDVASILKFTLRSADAIARIGGDEFIVLAIGGDGAAVGRLNERLQEGFSFFNATTARPYRIAVSSGTAWCEPGEPCAFEQLKASADSEMYAEKLRRTRAG
jgi:diguanylate cyclase (GGDEF)-like protein/PAS domain S-box-containing protein